MNYNRVLLAFAFALRRTMKRVEIFAFNTTRWACSDSWRDVSSATQEIISRRHTFTPEIRAPLKAAPS